MQSQFVDAYTHMRDHLKPVAADLRLKKGACPERARAGYDTDVAAITALRTFCPPSKAHVKRIQRVRPDITRPRVVPALPATPEYDFYKVQLRALK